jgi:hypothetical protein
MMLITAMGRGAFSRPQSLFSRHVHALSSLHGSYHLRNMFAVYTSPCQEPWRRCRQVALYLFPVNFHVFRLRVVGPSDPTLTTCLHQRRMLANIASAAACVKHSMGSIQYTHTVSSSRPGCSHRVWAPADSGVYARVFDCGTHGRLCEASRQHHPLLAP